MQNDFKIGLLATGSELLDGRISDSNGKTLANKLATFGLELDRIVVCGDLEPDIAPALSTFKDRYSVVVVTGGLGPTFADQTRESLSHYFNIQLEQDEAAVRKLTDFFTQRQRTPTESDFKQTYFPKGAVRLENPYGTADGFYFRQQDLLIIALPGVPKEFNSLCDYSVMDVIREAYISAGGQISVVTRKQAYCFGLGEAKLAEMLDMQPGLKVRAILPCLEVSANSAEDLERSLAHVPKDFVYSSSGYSLPEAVYTEMKQRGLTLSAAESCTGGIVSSLITRIPGSSSVFLGGITAYANEIKQCLLRVPEEIIRKYGAVSYECVQLMADNARLAFKSSIAVSVSGVAGPSGGTERSPVGTVYFGLSLEGISKQFRK